VTSDKAEGGWRHTDLVRARHWTAYTLPCFNFAAFEPSIKALHVLPICFMETTNISSRASYLPKFAIHAKLECTWETTLREVVNTSVRSGRIDK